MRTCYLGLRNVLLSQTRSLLALLFVVAGSVLSHSALAQNPGNLSSTNETWQSDQQAIYGSPAISAGDDLLPSGSACIAGDFYGNGLFDMACLMENLQYSNTSNSPTSLIPSGIFVLKNNASAGFSASVVYGSVNSYTVNSTGSMPGCAVGDFDGDGRTDLACFTFSLTASVNCDQITFVCHTEGIDYNYPTVWFSEAGKPLSRVVQNANLTLSGYPSSGSDYDKGATSTFNTPYFRAFGNSCTVGHFMEGAGQQILCNVPSGVMVGYHNMTNSYSIWKFVGSYNFGVESISESEQTWANGPTGPSGKLFGQNCLTGDFNGDGLTDIACEDGAGSWNIGLSTGVGFAESDWQTGDNSSIYVSAFTPIANQCATADLNGDGKTDIICYVPNSGNTFHVYLSTGSGFQPLQIWTFDGMSAVYTATSKIFGEGCQIADLNGDGKSDILCYSDNSNAPADWTYALSDGKEFVTGHLQSVTPPEMNSSVVIGGVKATSPGMPFANACILGNFINNGLTDILCNLSGGYWFQDSSGNVIFPAYPYSLGILNRQ